MEKNAVFENFRRQSRAPPTASAHKQYAAENGRNISEDNAIPAANSSTIRSAGR
jgi:hypothetical protein